MLDVNWLVRFKNKAFWVAFIPAILVLVQMIAQLFGFELDLATLQGKLLAVIDAAFAVLIVLGVVVDPTTVGIQDSVRAMGYDEPAE